MKIKQELDLNLHHLFLTLDELAYNYSYPGNITEKIQELIDYIIPFTFYVDKKGRDIEEQKAYLVTIYKED